MPLDLGRAFAQRKYESVNLAALAVAKTILPDVINPCPQGFDLAMVSSHLIGKAVGWSLPWKSEFEYLASDPRKIGCAIVVDDQLCGLALGRINKKGTSLSFSLLEGNPDPLHPFKGHVLDTIEVFGLSCCNAIGATELRFVNPLEGALEHYLESGFALVEGPPTYCVKVLK